MSLTEAQVAQVLQMLDQANAAQQKEAMSSMTSFERFLDRNGVLDKVINVLELLNRLAYIFS